MGVHGMTDIENAIEEAKSSMLPFESWERLRGESTSAFAAFCAFRDYGAERNIRKAVDGLEKDEAVRAKRYRVWRNWCSQFRWRERAADYAIMLIMAIIIFLVSFCTGGCHLI